MIPKRMAAAICVAAYSMAFSLANDGTALRAAPPEAKTDAPANFDMASYLAALSAEGKKRGYKEFVYKKTPQGELRIYFALPADWAPKDKRPALIFFSGGGWSGTNVFSCAKVAEHFAKLGVVVGLADYRVRKHHGVKLDKCAEDARSTVRWLRANCKDLGVDPGRVIAGGGSAGGHIAACTAISDAPNSDTDDLKVSCIPNGLLLYYPVASLVDDRRANGFKQMLGGELALALSPARHVTKSWPPTVLFSGTADIELANGILLHNKAKEAGVNIEMYVIEGGGHGVVNTESRDSGWRECAADFFMRAGMIDKKGVPAILPKELRKYNGEPVEKIMSKPEGTPSKPGRKRGTE